MNSTSESLNTILKEIFARGDFDSPREPLHKNHHQPVKVISFPTVHENDSEPLTIIWPDIQNGPWIAGGACLRWYQGQPVGESDIDVFCANAKQAADLIAEIKSYGRYSVKFESENAVTLEYQSHESWKNRWTIQIITRRYFSSLNEVIDNFDISVCQIGTGGQEWLLGSTTAKDIREKNLRMRMPLQPDAAKRLVKYWTYGYRPVEGLLDAVRFNPNGKWKYDINDTYQNAF